MGRSARLKHQVGRSVAFVVAGVIVADVLMFERTDWFERLTRWNQPAPRSTLITHEPTKTGPIGAPVTVTPMRPLGNDSSISLIPLPLILVSTQPGRNSREGSAQIGVSARSPQTYGAGALLANDACLTEIYPHYVVLERGGRAVRLYRQGESQLTGDADPGLLTVGGTTPAAPLLVNSHDALTDFLRPTPTFNGATLRGYALFAGHEPAAFAQLGLEPGDVLTAINGVVVTGPDSLAALYTLTEGAALAVVIERHGARRSVSLDGSIVVSAIARQRTAVPMIKSKETTL